MYSKDEMPLSATPLEHCQCGATVRQLSHRKAIALEPEAPGLVVHDKTWAKHSLRELQWPCLSNEYDHKYTMGQLRI